EEGADDVRRAIRIRDSLGKRSDAFYMGLVGTLAGALDMANRPREAITAYHHASALLESSGRGSTMDAAITEHDMALTLLRLGENAEAERAFHDALIRARQSDPSGRVPSQPLIHYADVAMYQADYDSAAKYFSMLAAQAAADSDRYWLARALFGLAETQLRAGDVQAAQQTMARFHPLSGNPNLKKVDDYVTDYRLLEGRLAFLDGRFGDAQQHVTDVLHAIGYFNGKRMRIFYPSLILAGEIAVATGRSGDALTYAAGALDGVTRDSLTETRSAFVGESHLLEARALLARGDTAATRTAIARAVTALKVGAGDRHPVTKAALALQQRVMQ